MVVEVVCSGARSAPLHTTSTTIQHLRTPRREQSIVTRIVHTQRQWRESNSHRRLRTPLLYPLSYIAIKEGTGRNRTCVVWATTGSFTTKLLPHQKVPGRLELPSPTFAEWRLNHFDYGTMIAPRRVALRSIIYKMITLNQYATGLNDVARTSLANLRTRTRTRIGSVNSRLLCQLSYPQTISGG